MSYRYIAFNKPYGVLSQFTDEGSGHPTLKEYIKIPGVYAAGRLDRESEGLLLLTDDGKLIKRLTDPRKHAVKTYLVFVEGDPSPEKLNLLQEGIILKDYKTLPCEVQLIPTPDIPPRTKPVTPHGPTSWLEVKLKEGKNRQIRHMTAAVNLFTLRIIRISIDCVQLGELKIGEWRELSPIEIQELKTNPR